MLQKLGVTLNSGHVNCLWLVCDFTYSTPFKMVLQKEGAYVSLGQSVAVMSN